MIENEMTALEYLTVRKEICYNNEKNGLIYCKTCAFNCNDVYYDYRNACDFLENACDFLEINYPDKAIEVVKKYIETKEKEKGNKK